MAMPIKGQEEFLAFLWELPPTYSAKGVDRGDWVVGVKDLALYGSLSRPSLEVLGTRCYVPGEGYSALRTL